MHDARQSYLEAQVMTATPQKLRLMLIEGAIRLARDTVEHWNSGKNDEGSEALIRCREIISELIGGIEHNDSELTKTTSSIYLFLFQSLVVAQLEQDVLSVQDVIKVLEVERETWQQVCEKNPQAPKKPDSTSNEITATNSVAIPPMKSSTSSAVASSSISLDA